MEAERLAKDLFDSERHADELERSLSGAEREVQYLYKIIEAQGEEIYALSQRPSIFRVTIWVIMAIVFTLFVSEFVRQGLSYMVVTA